MWMRNLLFLGLCLVGLSAFTATVFPPPGPQSREIEPLDTHAVQSVVAKVDAAFAEDWRHHGLEPALPAPDLAVARRMSLALAGVIPSLEEIRLFEARPAGERIEWWLAYLLSDQRYADYVAERLARAFVGVEDGPFLVYRRRRFVSWLADQLRENQPYDRLARHLIADSGLWTDTPATNFITVTVKPGDDEQPNAKMLAARVSRAMLGVRLDCAECHDHPFEPWKQRDFQSLAAFFGQTVRSPMGIADGRGKFEVENRLTGKLEVIEPAVPYQPELLPRDGSRRRQLAVWVTHKENKAFAREAVNRAWALLFGRPLVQPIDNISAAASLPPALDLLADDFVSHHYDWRRLLSTIAATRAFRQDSRAKHELTPEHAAHWAMFPITRLRSEQVVGALLQAASLTTIDYESHILIRFARQAGQSDFVKRYGDAGAEEFENHGGTLPQRLLMMNGNLVKEKTKENIVGNAATRIAVLAPTDEKAIETAMLAVLTRRPTAEEAEYFSDRLERSVRGERNRRLEDFYWSLLNTTEFSWNH